jgi:nitrate reductase gamma subunit
MEKWIEFAKGPLFTITFLIMILGLVRLVVIQTYALIIRKGRRLKDAPWKKIAAETMSWAFPVRHLIRGTVFFSLASILFHVGAIIVPIFLGDHIVLWEQYLGFNLPSIGKSVADFLTLLTIACLVLLLAWRTFIGRVRAMSRPIDYALLLLIMLPFMSGYLASHPTFNPIPWEVMMLIHLLSAEVLFVIVPFSKLAHVVLFAFDRISAVHWQLRPGAGDKVAEALFGSEARV